MSLFKELNRIFHAHGFFPSRKKAQNFAIKEELVDKIVKTSKLSKNDVVLEIGPGAGFLTREMLKHSKVIGIELDSVLCTVLKEKFSKELENGKFVLAEGSFFSSSVSGFNKVVCLPPYNISSRLLASLAPLSDVTMMVFVFQREFVKKCTASAGFKEYGFLSVLLGYYFDSIVVVWSISPENFFPKPNAFSSLVVFSRKKNASLLPDHEKFMVFLKNVFRFKNKKLSNALEKSFPFMKKALGISKKGFENKISFLKLKNKKAYLLEPQEFVEVFKELSK